MGWLLNIIFRQLSKSTIICSLREPKSWASMILNDEVSSNAIMKQAAKLYINFGLKSHTSRNFKATLSLR